VLAGVAMTVLGWQAGGGIGSGGLRAVGASPWQLGAAITAELVVISSAVLAGSVAWRRWVRPAPSVPTRWERLREQFTLVAEAVRDERATRPGDDDAGDADKLAG
jgi:hypothetical protein